MVKDKTKKKKKKAKTYKPPAHLESLIAHPEQDLTTDLVWTIIHKYCELQFWFLDFYSCHPESQIRHVT